MRKIFSNIIILSILSLAGLAATSCSLVEEERTDCPTGLFIRFVYDYNTMRADMFKDHVGHVQVYIFDEDGQLAAQRSVSNTADYEPLSRYGYTMHFTPEELPAGHSYRIQAVAMQRDWDEALDNLPGAKYRMSISPLYHSESLRISLDRDNDYIDDTEQHAVSNEAPLDTLWHTLKVIPHEPTDGATVPDIDKTRKPYSIYPQEDQLVRVEKDRATYATVSLIRDTKHLNLTLRHVDEPETVYATDYEVHILDNNAHVAHDNTVLTHDSVRYTPYASWTARQLDNGKVEIEDVHYGNPGQYHAPTRDLEDAEPAKVNQRSAHYNIMFNCLMFDTDNVKNNAALEIHNKKTGDLVARVNLPYILSVGRQAYEIQNYGHQEYLDREYDYHLDFFLKGDSWIAVEIHVLSWSRRVQYIEF